MNTKTGLALAAAVAVIGIPGAVMMGHAHHEPQPPPAAPVSPEQKYLDSLTSQGLMETPGDVVRQRDTLLRLGNMVCSEVHDGMDDNEIVPTIRAEAHINSHNADIILVAAKLHLCK